MSDSDEHVSRALEFTDRALAHLAADEPEIHEVLILLEGIRNELTALHKQAAFTD